MAKVELKIETRVCRIVSAISDKNWTHGEKQKFHDEWDSLIKHGAEMIDTQFIGSRLVAYPSSDFTMHCAKYGIHP